MTGYVRHEPVHVIGHVKRTLAAGMPAPVARYLAGGLAVPRHPIAVPTFSVTGADDGARHT